MVSIDLGCSDYPIDSKKKIVFSAEYSGGTTVETEWKSFDTLIITYSDKLEPITLNNRVTYDDSTLNLTIEFNKDEVPSANTDK